MVVHLLETSVGQLELLPRITIFPEPKKGEAENRYIYAIGAIYRSTEYHSPEKASWPLLWLASDPSYLRVAHNPKVLISMAVQLVLHL